MSDDIRTFLAAADGGPASPDLERIRRRSRQLTLTRRAGFVAAAVVVVGLGAGIVAQAGGSRPEPPIVTDPSPAQQGCAAWVVEAGSQRERELVAELVTTHPGIRESNIEPDDVNVGQALEGNGWLVIGASFTNTFEGALFVRSPDEPAPRAAISGLYTSEQAIRTDLGQTYPTAPDGLFDCVDVRGWVEPPPPWSNSSQGDPSDKVSSVRQIGLTDAPVEVVVDGQQLWVLGPPGPDLQPALLHQFDHQGKVRSIPVGIAASDVAAGFGSVWVANASGAGDQYSTNSQGPGFPLENSIQRISAEDDDTIAVDNPVVVATGHGSAWALTPGGGGHPATVTRIDPGTHEIVATTSIDGSGGQMALTSQAVWVLTGTAEGAAHPTELSRIDPRTNEVTARIPMDVTQIAHLSATDDVLLVVDTGDDANVFAVDQSNQPRRLPIRLSFPQAATTSGGQLWVVEQPYLVRVLDIGSGKQLAFVELNLAGSVRALATAQDGVWAATQDQLLLLSFQ